VHVYSQHVSWAHPEQQATPQTPPVNSQGVPLSGVASAVRCSGASLGKVRRKNSFVGTLVAGECRIFCQRAIRALPAAWRLASPVIWYKNRLKAKAKNLASI
jgi:hypothetical protein